MCVFVEEGIRGGGGGTVRPGIVHCVDENSYNVSRPCLLPYDWFRDSNIVR